MKSQWMLHVDQRGAFITTKSAVDDYIAWFNNPTPRTLEQLEQLVQAHNKLLEGIRTAVMCAVETLDSARGLEHRKTAIDD